MTFGTFNLDGAVIVHTDKPALAGEVRQNIQRGSKRRRTFHCLRFD